MFKLKVKKIRAVILIISILVMGQHSHVLANEDFANDYDEHSQDSILNEPFSEAQLAQILSPIALYPDVILSHILMASTYPLEVVSAHRWYEKHKGLAKNELIKLSQQQDWDESVKILIKFPHILSRLNNNLTWMQNLGDAFLNDQEQTLAIVQKLRLKADSAGYLSDIDNLDIIKEDKTIIIRPTEPDVIYVPYYDPRVVYGHWYWVSRPPIYWSRPVNYVHYHRGYYWHRPVRINVNLFFGHIYWPKRHVVVHQHNRYKRHSHIKRVSSRGTTIWRHNPKHRKGVAYKTAKKTRKYHTKHNRKVIHKTKVNTYNKAEKTKIAKINKVEVKRTLAKKPSKNVQIDANHHSTKYNKTVKHSTVKKQNKRTVIKRDTKTVIKRETKQVKQRKSSKQHNKRYHKQRENRHRKVQ